MARVLGVVRQSRKPRRSKLADEEGNSVEEQQGKITAWAALHDHQIVGWAVDTDVSGHLVSPFERPELSKWLEHPEGFDILCSSKLDRLSRNVGDFAALVKWAQDGRGISIVCVRESFDLGTAMGRMVAGMLVLFAEYEWEQIRSRRIGAVETLVQKGLWKGGLVPYGYCPVDNGSGWRMGQDPDTAPVVRHMVRAAIDGESYVAICKWLNAEGILTRTGKTWRPETVRQILVSHNLTATSTTRKREKKTRADGRTVERLGPPKIVRDAQGHPIRFSDDPILTDDQWAQLQAALSERKVTNRNERADAHLLLRVAICEACDGAPMYALARPGRPNGGYYRCLSCGMHVAVRQLEDFVEAALLEGVGSRDLLRRVIVPGDDGSRDIARVENELEAVRAIATVDMSAAVTALEAEVARLRALPHQPDDVSWEPVGHTVRVEWESLDQPGRNKFLRSWGVTALCRSKDSIVVRLGGLPVDGDEAEMRDPVQQPQPRWEPTDQLYSKQDGKPYPIKQRALSIVRDPEASERQKAAARDVLSDHAPRE